MRQAVAALARFGLRSWAVSTLALISANPGCSQTEPGRGLGMANRRRRRSWTSWTPGAWWCASATPTTAVATPCA